MEYLLMWKRAARGVSPQLELLRSDVILIAKLSEARPVDEVAELLVGCAVRPDRLEDLAVFGSELHSVELTTNTCMTDEGYS